MDKQNQQSECLPPGNLFVEIVYPFLSNLFNLLVVISFWSVATMEHELQTICFFFIIFFIIFFFGFIVLFVFFTYLFTEFRKHSKLWYNGL